MVDNQDEAAVPLSFFKIRLLDNILNEATVVQAMRQLVTGRGTRILEKGSRSDVLWIQMDNGTALVAKRYFFRKIKSRLEYFIGMDKSARTVRAGRVVKRLGINTPRIHALVREGGFLLPHGITLLAEAIANARPMPAVYCELGSEQAHHLLEETVTFIRQVHDAGLFMPDFVKNIEVIPQDKNWKFFLFDMDNTHHWPGIRWKRRCHDLVRLIQYCGVTDRDQISALLSWYLSPPRGQEAVKRRLSGHCPISPDYLAAEAQRGRHPKVEYPGMNTSSRTGSISIH